MVRSIMVIFLLRMNAMDKAFSTYHQELGMKALGYITRCMEPMENITLKTYLLSQNYGTELQIG